jgi:tetratricopeptide (TPR) repeat protein
MKKWISQIAGLLLMFGVAGSDAAVPKREGALLRGIVVLNEINGRPVADVEISPGSNPTISDNHGRFTLRFADRVPGDSVRLTVDHKSGYRVVNEFQLKPTLPSDPNAEELILLVSTEADLEEMRRRFYRLKSDEAIAATFQEKLEELKRSGQDTEAAMADLRRERKQATDALEKLAEELARIKSGEASELYQKAMELFLKGKVEEALEVLKEENLREAAENVERQRRQVVENFSLKARLQTMQLKFSDAEKTYEQLIKILPGSFEAYFAYAVFLHKLARYPDALAAYDQALRWSEKPVGSANILNNQGHLLDRHLGKPAEALAKVEQALSTYRKLATEDDEQYSPDVAMTLHNLGFLHDKQNHGIEAIRAYDEAIRIRRNLVKNDAESHILELAGTLNNLAACLMKRLEFEQALPILEEARTLSEKLTKNNPARLVPELGDTLHLLGCLHEKEDRLEQAQSDYEKASHLRRRLANERPEEFLRSAAETLHELALLHRNQDRFKEAATAFDEALTMCRKMAEISSAPCEVMATVLFNFGELFTKQDPDQARQHYHKALEIYRRLAKAVPAKYLPEVADTLDRIGALHFEEHRADEARKHYSEALDIYRSLAEQQPDVYMESVAETLVRKGTLQLQNQAKEALQAFEEALKIYRGLFATQPDRFRTQVQQLETRLKELSPSLLLE